VGRLARNALRAPRHEPRLRLPRPVGPIVNARRRRHPDLRPAQRRVSLTRCAVFFAPAFAWSALPLA
jgi:hypothetical protein